MSKDKYFHNNWQYWKDAPEELMESVSYDQFMEWRVGGWELMSTAHCVIRATNHSTGKITEHVYKRPAAAQEKIEQMLLENNYDFTIVDDSTVKTFSRKDYTNG